MSVILVREVSLISILLVSCGAIEFPDSSSSYRAKNSSDGAEANSSELKFDLSKCGFDLSKPGSMIASRRMSMVPKTVTSTGFLGFQTTYKISSMSITEDSLNRSVLTFAAQSTPSSNSVEVLSAINNLTAGFAADLVPPSERANIGETYSDWRGVFCSFQPAKRIERGSTGKVTIELDKPLPTSPLLIADLARLKLEMGVKREWNAITAKVVESSDPEVPVGSVWTGRAFSQPVAGSVEVDGPSGKVNINVPLALKMTYDFGSPKTNQALGLPSSITWYVDDSTKSFKLTQVDFGDGALVNYLPDK